MQDSIDRIAQEFIALYTLSLERNRVLIEQAVRCIVRSLKNEGKIILFGNGGSAADSQHIAAEFIGRFQRERQALAALALSTDTSILTALSNDYSFDIIFARQIQALAAPQDVAVALSTSGNSKNVIEGITAAKTKGLSVISLTGHEGGQVAQLSDINILVPSNNTARIQEIHMCLAHMICEFVEKHF